VRQSELLLTTAQIGMALAGFAGLVTLLGRPTPRADSRLNEIRFRSMIELSLTLAAFGLLPFVPTELGLVESVAWRVSSAVYALACASFLLHSARRNRRDMGRVLIVGGVTATLFATCGVLALALGLDAAGALPGLESGVYCGALFFHFLAAAFFFIRLLYGALPGGPPAAGMP
jgi:uncharacterized membrane protein YozB (DUF420 family)